MQPIFVIMSKIPGLLYIGGKWVGEVTDNAPQSLPVSPQGPVYIEYRPLLPGFLPMARRITLSGGRVLKESIETQAGVYAVMWPGGAVELELAPETLPAPDAESRFMSARGISLEYKKGGKRSLILSRDGLYKEHSLPDNAEPPEIAFAEGRILLSGQSENHGRYLLCVSPDDFSPLLSVSGDEINLLENGAVRVARALDDTAGHIKTEVYAQLPAGYSEPSYEIRVAEPQKRAILTPEETALAAAEAILLRLTDEAEQYFTKEAAYSVRGIMETILDSSGVTGMKYFIPGGKNAIGLIKAEAQNLLSVAPLFYETSKAQGGGYQIMKLSP